MDTSVIVRISNDFSFTLDEAKDEVSQYQFSSREAAQNALAMTNIGSDYYSIVSPDDDTVDNEIAIKRDLDFRTKFTSQSQQQGSLKIEVQDVELNAMSFASDGKMEHGITPRESSGALVEKLLSLNESIHDIDSTLAKRFTPALIKIANIAKSETTSDVRQWVVDNASSNGKPDTRALLAVIQKAENTQNEPALAMIYSLARYEKSAEGIAKALGDAVHGEQKLNFDQTQKLALMADHILMQAYAEEAFSSSHSLKTTAPMYSFFVEGDAKSFAENLLGLAKNFNISGVLSEKYNGANAQELVTEFTVKSPIENLRGLSALWVRRDEPAETFKDIFGKNTDRTTQQGAFLGFEAESKQQFDKDVVNDVIDTGTVDYKLKLASKESWIHGVENMIAQHKNESLASGDKTPQQNFEYYMKNQIVKAVEFAFDKELGELDGKELQVATEALKSEGYGHIGDALVALAKYEAENGPCYERRDESLEVKVQSKASQSNGFLGAIYMTLI